MLLCPLCRTHLTHLTTAHSAETHHCPTCARDHRVLTGAAPTLPADAAARLAAQDAFTTCLFHQSQIGEAEVDESLVWRA